MTGLTLLFLITSKKCLTGTDRVAEVAKKIKADLYINVQGDEPVFNSIDLKKLIKNAISNKTEVLLGYCEIKKKSDYFNKKIPKVVFDNKEYLMYSSRSPIPAGKKNKFTKAWKGVWAYSFPRDKLLKFSKRHKKTFLEKSEDIEILRFIELGIDVKMIKMSDQSKPIDVKSDVKEVLRIIKKNDRKK